MFKVSNKLSSAFIALTFILFTGSISSVSAKDDTRLPVVLTEDERNLVLAEMRVFLDTIRNITVSLSMEELENVAKAAKKVGMSASREVPPELTKKLPKQFKMLAMKVHKGFDQIALDAIDMQDKQQALEQLGVVIGDCVACHTIYRLPEPL